MRAEASASGGPQLTQEIVDALSAAHTMEEYLAIAEAHGIDWNALDDEWLEAVVSGDVTELLWRQERRLRRAGKAKHAQGI